MDEGAMMQQGNVCKCPHHKAFPLLIVLFGLDFLGGALGWWNEDFVSLSWPVLVILAGGMKLVKGKCKCCPHP